MEITTVNNVFKEEQGLKISLLGRGFAWLDTGTHESLFDASNFIGTIEKRQGLKVACLEEIAFRNRWITAKDVLAIAEPMKKNAYGQYLINLINLINK